MFLRFEYKELARDMEAFYYSLKKLALFPRTRMKFGKLAVFWDRVTIDDYV
jgi:hypothetical protein